MKSIRLSLVGYFLILLVGALGAVSWLVYQTASRTLSEKEQSTVDLVKNTCEQDVKAVREAFDQRLLLEAQKLNSLCRESAQRHEFYYPLGMLAAAPMPMSHLLLPLWIAEGAHPGLVGRLEGTPVWNPVFGTGSWLSEASNEKIVARFSLKGSDPHPEDPTNEKQSNSRNEFIQIERPLYHVANRPFGRNQKELLEQLKQSYLVQLTSESLGNQHLPSSNKELDHRFDEVDLGNLKLRRVIIGRTAVSSKSGQVIFRSPQGKVTGKTWFTDKTLNPPPETPNKDKKGKLPIRANYNYWEFLPFVFIHYAEDTSGLERKILDLQNERDRKLDELKNATQEDLSDLRRRLGWIGTSTFVGILVGSWLLICLGLAPLSRLSDAVSKVTPRDFHLQIDQQKLPRELMPIAGRMSEALDQLGKAFAREKQAAADISHELRTPLAALLTTAEVGLKKTRSPEEYRELLQECRLSGEHMMQLVERLLALARLDANADRLWPAPVDVGRLAQQCADMVRPLADARGLDLQVHAGESLSVQADGGKLREVLTNLLHNAIQYNKPEGSIDLTVERENGHLLMQVRDTGIGISAEARAHIFERFYRADPSRHSDTPHAGLGLAIVKSYIDLMGGRIDVDSGPAGSTFRIEVPAVDVGQPSTSFTAARSLAAK